MTTLDQLVEAGRVERVERNADGAALALEEARRHVSAAETIAEMDPNGAYQLAYDGARKIVAARMRGAGIRVRKGEGSHAITAEYARAEIDEALGKRFDNMRRRRNRSEYDSAYFEPDDIQDAIAVARALLDAVDN